MDDPPSGTRIETRQVYSGRLLKIDVDTVRTPVGQIIEKRLETLIQTVLAIEYEGGNRRTSAIAV